jgi:phosphotransferase system IIA component
VVGIVNAFIAKFAGHVELLLHIGLDWPCLFGGTFRIAFNRKGNVMVKSAGGD